MILVDSSVWIDALHDRRTVQTIALKAVRGRELIGTADLVLAEVLQGARDEIAFALARAALLSGPFVVIGSRAVAIAAARNYQALRALGITPRKTIDTLIATRCILDRIPLLYSDRDFDPFVEHLGLLSALDLHGTA